MSHFDAPADHLSPTQPPLVEELPVAVDASVVDAVAGRARLFGVSRSAALTLAFWALLSRYSGQLVTPDAVDDPSFDDLLAGASAQLAQEGASGRAAPFPNLVFSDGEVGVAYDRHTTSAETAAGLAEHFGALLAEIAADGRRPLSQLPLVGDAERHLLVDAWNDTALALPPHPVHELFEQQVARVPGSPAVGDRHGWLTYQDLNRQANRLAHHLRGLGTGPGSLVGICLSRRSAMVVALLGVLKAGGAYLPLDPDYPAERLAFMLADAGTSVVVTESDRLGRLPAGHRAAVVCLDRDAGILAGENDANPAAGVGLGDLAYVIFTSGSTGRPKGVLIEHRSVVSLVTWARSWFSASELERVLASTSLSFDLSVFEILVPLSGGTSVYVTQDLLDPTWHEAAPTLVNTVPSVLAAVLGDRGLPPSVVTVNLAGEPLGRDLLRATLATGNVSRVANLYGPSEATVYCTSADLSGGVADGDRVPIGRPLANTEIYLLDDQRRLVPQGAVGEIYIGGWGLALGYLNRPSLSAARFVDNPFRPGGRLYRSGDLGRYRADGTIDFFGRVDDQVKIRGFRIEPGEIEAALLAIPGIGQAAVISREDVPGQRQLVAYVVATDDDHRPPVSELRAQLGRSLPDHMVPAAFVYLAGLPRTPSGKLDRRTLPPPTRRAPPSGHSGPGVGSVGGGAGAGVATAGAATAGAARTATEATLVEIWADVLKLPRVGVEDDFFDLGGHSLLAVEMVTRVEEAFHRKLPATVVLQAATIAALASMLDDGDPRQLWRSVFPIRTRSQAEPARLTLFCLHGLAGDVTGYRHLLPYLGHDQPLYGIQCVGLDGQQPPLTRVEDMAAFYIAEIRHIQPEGPYLLAGICFGSLVAYEMAHLLTTRDRAEVALMALVDPTPLPERTLGEQLRRRVAKFRRVPPGERRAFLADTATIMATVAQQAAWGVLVSRRLGERPVPRNHRAMEAVNIQAQRRYLPPPYDGPIVLYRSEGLATDDSESRALAWATLSGPNVERVDIAGASHESLFVEPYIRRVGEHLRRSIDRAMEGVGGGGCG